MSVSGTPIKSATSDVTNVPTKERLPATFGSRGDFSFFFFSFLSFVLPF